MTNPALITCERTDAALLIHVTVERIDEDNVGLLQSEISAMADTARHLPVVVDLSQVNFMPSLSLAALVRLSSEFRSRQQRLLLAGLQPQVREVFVLMHLNRLFELHPDTAAALRAARAL